jgi:hypothetical protein
VRLRKGNRGWTSANAGSQAPGPLARALSDTASVWTRARSSLSAGKGELSVRLLALADMLSDLAVTAGGRVVVATTAVTLAWLLIPS